MPEGDLAHSFCGSPEYMSPEMLMGQGHSLPVDYYSLGAILFEMITGLPPHYDQDRDTMYQQIVCNDLEYPSYLSAEVVSLIECFMQKDPKDRVGFKQIQDIKDHPWCSDIDWKKVETKSWRMPPIRPDIMKSNFDPEYTSLPIDQAQNQLPGFLNTRRQNQMSYYCNIDQSAASFYQGDSLHDIHNMSKAKLDSPNKSINKDLESSGVFDDFSFYSDPVEEKEVQR
jgi:serum/glucocorticoid-regulated kinase 2